MLSFTNSALINFHRVRYQFYRVRLIIFPECQGPLKPEVVWSTSLAEDVPASNILILGRDDTWESWDGPTRTSWLTEEGATIGQGFIMKVDTSLIANLKSEI